MGTFQHGISWAHYATKTLSNLIPFGGYFINLETPLSTIDPTSKFKILFNSDDCLSLLNISNTVDSFSFTSAAKSSKSFRMLGFAFSLWGASSIASDISKDKIIKNFMNSQETDLFYGVMSDKSAISLGIYLAEGALYYDANKERMEEKGISKTEWGKRIRKATNNSTGQCSFESYEKLENVKGY